MSLVLPATLPPARLAIYEAARDALVVKYPRGPQLSVALEILVQAAEREAQAPPGARAGEAGGPEAAGGAQEPQGSDPGASESDPGPDLPLGKRLLFALAAPAAGATGRDLARRLRTKRATVYSELAGLVAAGSVVREGKGPKTRFSLTAGFEDRAASAAATRSRR